MKRILLALAIASASLVTFNSCTKEYITNSLPGISYTSTIANDAWTRISGTNTYVNILDFPELDSQYDNYGYVLVAIEFPYQKGVYKVLNATIDNIHYRYEYSVGKVIIEATVLSGGVSADFLSNDIGVKVTLTDADDGGN